MIKALVLCAGLSQRMGGSFKPLLAFDEETMIEKVVHQTEKFFSLVYLVVGYRKEEVKAKFLNDPKVRFIENACYREGMYSSFIAGLSSVNDDIMLFLGDMPLIKDETIRELLQNAKGEVVIPTFKGERGHPVFISKKVRDEIVESPQEFKTPREALDKFRIRYLEVADEGVNIDVDVMDDYQKLVNHEQR